MKCANVAFSVVPRIDDGDFQIETEFDMVYCFGIRLAPNAICFFFTRIYLQHVARPVESDRPINILFVRPSFRPSILPYSVYECRVITLQALGIDSCNFRERSRKDISHQDHLE